MALQFVGPYSADAYQAAEMIAAGGSGAPYAPGVIDTAHEILRLNGVGGNTQVLGASTTASNAPGPASAPVKQVNQGAVNATQQAIDSLGTEQTTGNQNIEDSFNSLTGKYNRESAQAEEDFNTQNDTNSNNLQKNKQNALNAAAQGRRGLRGTLAAIGALSGDGSVLADRAVTQGANADIGEAADTFGTNAQTLDRSIKKFREEDADRRAEAETTRTNQKTALEGSLASKRQNYYQKMAEIYGDADKTAEANDWLGKAGALNNEIASKTRVAATPFAAKSAAFTPGDLESYLAGAGDMTVNVKAGGNGESNAPTIVADRKEKKDKQLVTA